MRTRTLFLVLPSLISAHAIKLLVASYKPENGTSGALQTLAFNHHNASLHVTHTNHDCGALPSWLDVSPDGSTVTCVNEADPGSLTAFDVQCGGSLEVVSNTSTPGGPVSNAYFGNGSAVAMAHYLPPAISTFAVESNNTFRALQNFSFNYSSTNPEPQDKAHIHQALLDPTGQYILFPDLGADLIRVYCIEPKTNNLVAHESLKTKPKYGPRHAVFWSPEDSPTNVFLFVIHELSNKIVSYSVKYKETGGLEFCEVDEVSTFGNRNVTEEAAASEIVKTPNNEFVIASNRLAPIFDFPNPDPKNSTMIKSDSLVTFKPTESGKLEFVELVASGGMNPRHFSLNEDGSKIAVANQVSKTVVVWARDVDSGKTKKQIAVAYNLGPGDLTNVQWLLE